jgi:hypothetical protein
MNLHKYCQYLLVIDTSSTNIRATSTDTRVTPLTNSRMENNPAPDAPKFNGVINLNRKGLRSLTEVNWDNLIPPGITEIHRLLIANNLLTDFVGLPGGAVTIAAIYAHGNQISSFAGLESTVLSSRFNPTSSEHKRRVMLYVDGNCLTSFDGMPDGIDYLSADKNQIGSFAGLSLTVTELSVAGNQITHFRDLPHTVEMLTCGNNPIESITYLPNSTHVNEFEYNSAEDARMTAAEESSDYYSSYGLHGSSENAKKLNAVKAKEIIRGLFRKHAERKFVHACRAYFCDVLYRIDMGMIAECPDKYGGMLTAMGLRADEEPAPMNLLCARDFGVPRALLRRI